MAKTEIIVDQPAARRRLLSLLGDLPTSLPPCDAEVISVDQDSRRRVERLVLNLNGVEGVPAYFVSPTNLPGPAPTVVYLHAHGGNWTLGKDELLLGRDSLQNPPFGEILTQKGYCVLCIDQWNFGERRGRTETELFKEMLWKGQTLWGMMLFDNLRSLDYLQTRTEVDPRRIATLGLSMGSTLSWWLAALDTRVKVCVDICCLTDYQSLIESRGLDGHGVYYYVPGLLKEFSAGEINALIAPRFHLALAGDCDPLTPPAGLDRIDSHLKKVYADVGRPEAWRLHRSPTGHFETAVMRREVLQFLEAWL